MRYRSLLASSILFALTSLCVVRAAEAQGQATSNDVHEVVTYMLDAAAISNAIASFVEHELNKEFIDWPEIGRSKLSIAVSTIEYIMA